jgi:hypothetical protein
MSVALPTWFAWKAKRQLENSGERAKNTTDDYVRSRNPFLKGGSVAQKTVNCKPGGGHVKYNIANILVRLKQQQTAKTSEYPGTAARPHAHASGPAPRSDEAPGILFPD